QCGPMAPGQVEACIASPPYEASVQVGHHPKRDLANAQAAGHTLASMRNPGGQLRYPFEYGDTPGQLGQTQADTFWSAARTILEQVFQVLKPGGWAIWIVKAYCRDGAIV